LFDAGNNRSLEILVREPAAGYEPINVVFIHGYGIDHTEWDAYPYLLPKNFRFILVDLYFHGGSSECGSTEFQDEDLANARDIAAYLKHNKYDKYFLVGHSFGGRVSGLIAAQEKEHVLGAVLITPVPVEGFPYIDLMFQGIDAALEVPGGMEAFANSMNTAPGRPPRPTRKDKLDELVKVFTKSFSGDKDKLKLRTTAMKTDRSSIIYELSCPVLFITGDHDFFLQYTLAELSKFKNTFANLQSFMNNAHLLTVDNPSEVAKAITEFISHTLQSKTENSSVYSRL